MMNISKCQSMVLARKHRRHQLPSIQLLLHNNVIQPQRSVKYLGALVDECLNWSDHALAAIRRISVYLSTNIMIILYNAFVLLYLTYCCVVWHFCSKLLSDQLQCIQIRMILKQPPGTSSQYCLQLLNWLDLHQQRNLFVVCFLKLRSSCLRTFHLCFCLILHLVMPVLKVGTNFICSIHRLTLAGTLTVQGSAAVH